MKSKLLKLDAPYNVIYAGGYVGRHIATLVTWTEDEDGDMIDTVSHPIIDRGEEYPAGKLVMEDLDDCRVLCPPGGTNLFWVANIIEYDFQQLEPVGPYDILQRMRFLNCFIKMPIHKDQETGEEVQDMEFEASLDSWCLKGFGEPGSLYRVKGNRFNGFYFQAEGTVKEIYIELSSQLGAYQEFFHDDLISIRFYIDDPDLMKITNRLNADQRIEGYKHENYDW
ncbi:MAG: hypothetical protein K6G92_00710 [Bacteroidaceae bacterium]|nr:hypothetical protein [Bacteroidaceae bacterium]